IPSSVGSAFRRADEGPAKAGPYVPVRQDDSWAAAFTRGLSSDEPFLRELLLAGTHAESLGSNNWVVDGTLTASGRPMLANDPHRPVQLPSLRKTVHLVGPGWNAVGAGETALPGIALGHNENIAFGFTIAGIDQQYLYVEKVNPANEAEYHYRG